MEDIGRVGCAAEKFLDLIQSAVGTLYRPRAIRLDGRAAAEAEAYKIVALAKADKEAVGPPVQAMADVRDFGLNAMPKKSFLSEYSSRITPQKVTRLLALWHDQLAGESLVTGVLNLDFHSVPYFGEHPLVEAHVDMSMPSNR